MKTQVEKRFSDFFEKWVHQLEEHVLQLLRTSKQKLTNESELQVLISKVTTHYKEYYTVKWAQAHEDILAFFSPVWCSPLEYAYAWVTGWKPSMVFRLVDSMRKTKGISGVMSLADMSEEQVKKVEELRMKMKLEEEKVEREMERQQVALADRRMVELARASGRVINRRVSDHIEGLVESALKALFCGLEKVMEAADCVRLKTLKGVLDLLSPSQCVDFLAAFSLAQIQIRRWGKKLISQYCDHKDQQC